MKKLYAILALVVLTSVIAWSAPVNQSITLTNNAGKYTANIFCLPSLTGGASITLGNFFTSQTNVNVSSVSPQVYRANGPNPLTMLINIKANGAGLTSSGFVISGTMNAADKLSGGWSILEADGLGLDPGEYNTVTGDYVISEAADWTCNGAPWTATYQPALLTTGTITGTETFPITLTFVWSL